MKHAFIAFGATLLCTALAPAHAATTPRSEVNLAAGACQPATAIADGGVRKRPLAVQNEGTSSVFVTCGLVGTTGAAPFSSQIFVGLRNNTASDVSVNCTLVDAGNSLVTPVYFPKSIVVPANAVAPGVIAWTTADNAGARFIYPAISCNLPPGLGVSAVGWYYDEEIGS